MNSILIKNVCIRLLIGLAKLVGYVSAVGLFLYLLVSQQGILLAIYFMLGVFLSLTVDNYNNRKDQNQKSRQPIKIPISDCVVDGLVDTLILIVATILIFIAGISLLCIITIMLHFYKITLPILAIFIIVFSIRNVYMNEKSKLNE